MKLIPSGFYFQFTFSIERYNFLFLKYCLIIIILIFVLFWEFLRAIKFYFFKFPLVNNYYLKLFINFILEGI